LSPKTSALNTVRQFQSEVASIREDGDPISARITIFVLTGLLIVVGLILCFARVDRTVSSDAGKIVTTEGTIVFQALDPSIIKSIDVKEGEKVQKGQLLATLDPTFAAADVSQLKQQIDSLQAQILRDEAELANHPLVFPTNPDPDFGKYQALQRQLFDQRAAQYAAQVNSFDQKIAQTQATVAKYQNDEGRYKEEEQIAKQVQDMRTTLAQHGTGSVLNLLMSTDTRLEALRTMEFDHNSLIESEHQLKSLKADRDAFIQQWSSATSQDLVTSRNSLDTARSQLEKAMKHRDLVRLVAQEESIVLTVAKLSVGSVLKEGDALLTLVPTRAPLEAEVQVSARNVGFMRAGDHATLKIDAFNYTEHGTAEGTVRWISEGAFTTDENGAPTPAYYKARIAITAVNLINVPGNFRLIPGMTLSGDVKVGTRSLAIYLIGGMIRGVGEAMREP
jgi:HlyD family secretion protein